MANKYFPINITLKSRNFLVVGGGKVALRKIELLMDFEADITVVAPEPLDKIEYYASRGKLKLHKRVYESQEASNYGMVVAASDDEAVNRGVYDDCREGKALVNVVDNPPLCDFIFPAMVKRDALTVAVSTDGKAPFLAAHLRLIMENIFPNHWSRIMQLAVSFRKKVQSRWGDNTKERFASLDRFLSADWKTMIKNKNDAELENELDILLESVEEDEGPEQKKPEDPGAGPVTLEFGGDD
ncbi:MAG: bifunctional precorrin-2 dehydrogenase/sirohydrochlorin ferrochelatase [candidate division Zixibacteria bacterium]